jgi:uncharacterized DUF497 family protein
MLNKVEFEWDENKNRSNQKEHNGITFKDAATVFSAGIKFVLSAHGIQLAGNYESIEEGN